MKVAPRILEQYSELTESQLAVVGHLDGPLLVIAGPGSGKTHSIILRALNLLLLSKAVSTSTRTRMLRFPRTMYR